MPYCTQCGAEVDPTNSFCTSCGASLDGGDDTAGASGAEAAAASESPGTTASTSQPTGQAATSTADTGAAEDVTAPFQPDTASDGPTDLLSRGVSFLLEHPGSFALFGVAGVIQLLAELLGIGSTIGGASGGMFVVALLFDLAAAVVVAVGMGVVIYGIATVGDGEFFDVEALARRSTNQLPAAIIAGLIWSIAVGIGLLFLVLPGIYLMLRFAVTPHLVFLEEAGPVQALQSSWGQTSGHLGTLLGILLAVAIPALILQVVPLVGRALATGVMTPIGIAAVTEFYLDLTDSTGQASTAGN